MTVGIAVDRPVGHEAPGDRIGRPLGRPLSSGAA